MDNEKDTGAATPSISNDVSLRATKPRSLKSGPHPLLARPPVKVYVDGQSAVGVCRQALASLTSTRLPNTLQSLRLWDDEAKLVGIEAITPWLQLIC